MTAEGQEKDLGAVEDITVLANQSMFMFRNLHVAYNVGSEGAAYALHVPEDPSEEVREKLFGILTLLGFDKRDARVERCIFALDESLPIGTMRLRPLIRYGEVESA